MREIKFKFYSQNKDNGRWSVSKTTLDELEENDSWHGSSPWIRKGVCQFTGIKDKNGKEIYEGDIIEEKWKEAYVGQGNEIDVVVWSNRLGAWALHNIEDKGEDWDGYLVFHCHPKHIKIIGNIYENPELLTNK